MNNESSKIKSFTDLNAWRDGYKLINGLIKKSRENYNL